MRILVTGHTGTVGQFFLSRYEQEYDVVGYSLSEGQDLLDVASLQKAMAGCDQVVHLAAIPKPMEGKTIDDYVQQNVQATLNVLNAAVEVGVKRVVFTSSTTIYGIEKGIPFATPIRENQPFVSQYLSAESLSCRDVDLSYHMSKVMAEQLLAWFGLNKKIQTVALRIGPVQKVFLGTSVSADNAAQAIHKALQSEKEFWYEPFSIVDAEVAHISIDKAKDLLGYQPTPTDYSESEIRSQLDAKTELLAS
ncbi:MAG: NAD(P)-dependent oxidoreductase [Alphaproteobacteria bacterium]|nr:NAD(P)-dependent oxidoreductase [Alphaproteobacteria bacterium]MDD9920166.1 NAD(P)-dependent oxidoreductase [Alphaproteobacteria bacterium]